MSCLSSVIPLLIKAFSNSEGQDGTLVIVNRPWITSFFGGNDGYLTNFVLSFLLDEDVLEGDVLCSVAGCFC